MDPEEALGGDEREGFVERHDLAAEGARVAPSLAAPPEDLNLVALTGWAQPGDRSAGAQAVECVALVSGGQNPRVDGGGRSWPAPVERRGRG